MNFLAHLLLSEPTPEARLGNLMGDFRKGPIPPDYPVAMQRGILLHPKIDAYTDAHPVTQLSRNLLNHHYRHFAGIVVDVVYDHFLAKNWSTYSDIPLPAFAQDVYAALRRYDVILPAALRRAAPYMIRQNWLVSYCSLDGIEKALSRISGQLRRENDLPAAIDELRQSYDQFQAHFDLFFPDLSQYVRLQIES